MQEDHRKSRPVGRVPDASAVVFHVSLIVWDWQGRSAPCLETDQVVVMGCHAEIILWHLRRFSQGFDGSRTVRASVRLRRREAVDCPQCPFGPISADSPYRRCHSSTRMLVRGDPSRRCPSRTRKTRNIEQLTENNRQVLKSQVADSGTILKNETAFISRRGRTCKWHGCSSLRPGDRNA